MRIELAGCGAPFRLFRMLNQNSNGSSSSGRLSSFLEPSSGLAKTADWMGDGRWASWAVGVLVWIGSGSGESCSFNRLITRNASNALNSRSPDTSKYATKSLTDSGSLRPLSPPRRFSSLMMTSASSAVTVSSRLTSLVRTGLVNGRSLMISKIASSWIKRWT